MEKNIVVQMCDTFIYTKLNETFLSKAQMIRQSILLTMSCDVPGHFLVRRTQIRHEIFLSLAQNLINNKHRTELQKHHLFTNYNHVHQTCVYVIFSCYIGSK